MARRKKVKHAIVFGLTAFILSAASLAYAQGDDVKLQRQLLPPAKKFVFVNKGKDLMYYQGFDKDNTFIGVVFTASGQGYNGIIEAGASMSPVGEILAIKVLRQDESPELGGRVAELPFLTQFLNKKPVDFDSIQAVTGATISSNAVVEMVRKKARAIAEDLK